MRRFTRGKKEALGPEAFEDGTQVSSEEIAAAANACGQTDALVAGTFSPTAGLATMLARSLETLKLFTRHRLWPHRTPQRWQAPPIALIPAIRPTP